MLKYAVRGGALAFAFFFSLFSGCGRKPSGAGQEVILFSVVGSQPFSDSVYTIKPNGWGRKEFLSPTRNTSYLYASGYNLKGPILIVVHTLLDNNRIGDKLSIYRPANNKWEAIDTPPGSVGRAVYSPDHSKLVFAFIPDEKDRFYRLYIKDSKTGEVSKLLRSHENESEGYASWRPDSKEFVFLSLSSSAGHLATKLLRVSEDGSDPLIVMGPDDSPGGAAHSPDGQRLCVLSKLGIEEFDLNHHGRRTILEWKQLPFQAYGYGSIAWSPISNSIAFTIFSKSTKKWEIWTVSPNGENLRRVYTVPDAGTPESVFFLTS
jgi:hypothetical protein